MQGAPGDIAQLSRALLSRIATSKKAEPCKQNETSQEAAERLDNDYQDKPAPEDYEDEPYDEEPTTADGKDTLHQEQIESNVDNTNQSKDETKMLKRKEPVDEETSPKRQCPKIIVE